MSEYGPSDAITEVVYQISLKNNPENAQVLAQLKDGAAQTVKELDDGFKVAARSGDELATSYGSVASAAQVALDAHDKQITLLRDLTGGVTQLGRAWGLYNFAREEDRQKAVQDIARLESLAQGVQGVVTSLQSGVQWWHQFAAARKAAAAAEAAVNFGTPAAIAGNVSAGASSLWSMPAAGLGGAVGLGVMGAGAMLGLGYMYGNDYIREGADEIMGWDRLEDRTAARGQRRKDLNQEFIGIEREQIRFDENESARRRVFDAGTGLTGLDQRRAEAGARQKNLDQFGVKDAMVDAVVSRNYSDQLNDSSYSNESQRARAMQQALQAEQTLQQAMQEERDLAKEIAQIAIDGKKQEIAHANTLIQAMEKNLSIAEKEVDLKKKNMESAQERFGDMDPLKREQAREAMEALAQGKDLNLDQKGLVRDLGLDASNKSLSEMNRKKGADLGFGDLTFAKQTQGAITEGQEKNRLAQLNIDLKVNAVEMNNEDIEKTLKELRAKLEEVQRNQSNVQRQEFGRRMQQNLNRTAANENSR